MQPDLPPNLVELQRQAAQAARLARAVAAATPARTEGSDSTGCARIAVGSDGVPAEIRIVDGWQRLHQPDTLAAAVLEANSDAARRATAAWSAALDNNRPEPAERTEIGTEAVAPYGQVAEVTELAERVLESLQRVQQQSSEPATHTGTDDGRHVTITLGPGGLSECLIDPRWAARHDGATITAALSTALRRAATGRTAVPRPGTDFDTLLGDALATLSALTQQPNHGDEDR